MTKRGYRRSSNREHRTKKKKTIPRRKTHIPVKEFDDLLEDPLPIVRARVRLRTEPDAYFSKRVKRDYIALKNIPMRVPSRLKTLLLPQSIAGRAQQGHGTFKGCKYVNTTVEDVVECLGKLPGINGSWKKFWQQRQEYIDDIWFYLDRALKDPSDLRVRRLVSGQGHPLAGCTLIPELHSSNDVISLLKGFIYTTRMDAYDPWRKRVKEKHGIEMGGGTCVAVSKEHMRKENLTLQDLATLEHDEKAIRALIAKGVLIDQPVVIPTSDVHSGYVRQKRGMGVSDDAAIITAYVLDGQPAYVGALWGDFIDTLDKSTNKIVKGGQDEMFGKWVRAEAERQGYLQMTDDEIIDRIALAAIDPDHLTVGAHCSQRYFYQEMEGKYFPSALHFEFANGLAKSTSFDEMFNVAMRMENIPLGFTRGESRTFYVEYVDRLRSFAEGEIIKLF